MTTIDKGAAMMLLKKHMCKVDPLLDEPEFPTSDETIVRYLKSSGWNPNTAHARLLKTVEYRRRNRPLTADCRYCHTRPGYHSMRQVGHDESGRPVIYANFAQAATHKNCVEDVVSHVTAIIENAKASITSPGTSTWVFVIDCTGMTMSACNPKIGNGMANILSTHYPERLGMVLCVNHNPLFNGVWKAVKGLVTQGTAAKVRLLSPDKVHDTFSTYFSDSLTSWLLEEMSQNRRHPLPRPQREFWNAPGDPTKHDPRGCPSYVKSFIDGFSPGQIHFSPGQPKAHSPHPNIVDAMTSQVSAVSLTPREEAERARAMSAASTPDDVTYSSSDEEEHTSSGSNSSRSSIGSRTGFFGRRKVTK